MTCKTIIYPRNKVVMNYFLFFPPLNTYCMKDLTARVLGSLKQSTEQLANVKTNWNFNLIVLANDRSVQKPAQVWGWDLYSVCWFFFFYLLRWHHPGCLQLGTCSQIYLLDDQIIIHQHNAKVMFNHIYYSVLICF